MKRIGKLQFILGVIVGAALFGGSVAIAAGIMAQPKMASVVIDGVAVDLKGYIIEGSHYFQLRDLDEKLMQSGKDFSVVWDGANNRIVIDTSRGYDPNETLPPPISEQEMRIKEYVAEVARLTNNERANAGLPPLTLADDLTEIAMIKSQDMVDNHYFSHESPTFGKTKTLMDTDVWVRYMGENLARGSRTPEAVVRGWMNHDGHRANILNSETTHMGIGIVFSEYGTPLWTQIFAIAK